MGTSINYFECCQHCVAPKRYPGCSGKCPEYKEARARLEADKERYRKQTMVDDYCNNKIYDSRDGLAKYRQRRPNRKYYRP